MRKVRPSLLAVTIGLAALFVCTSQRICYAKDAVSLEVTQGQDDLALELHAEWDIWSVGPWELSLATTVPNPLTTDNEQYATLVLRWDSNYWVCTGTAKYSRTATHGDGYLKLRTAFKNDVWGISAAVYRGWEIDSVDGEWGAEAYLSRKFGPRWRLAFYQDFRETVIYDGGHHHQYYNAEASLSWRGVNQTYSLSLGGGARRGDSAEDDTRSLSADLDWRFALGAGWSFSGRLAYEPDAEQATSTSNTGLNVALIRNAPLGLKIQGSYLVGDEARGGLTISGKIGNGLVWRAGAACEAEMETDLFAFWGFAVLVWRSGRWEIELGLAPSGEYAISSKHGYWIEVTWAF